MEQEIKKINRSIKIQPIFSAFADDLIFFVPIDTLFLTITKGLNASQIQFITLVSLLTTIVARKLILGIIEKVGNLNALKIGSFLLLISAVILTFANKFWIICTYRVVYAIAYMFLHMALIVLKNNLSSVNRGDDYFRIRNKTKIMYSITTMATAILSGYLFNLNNYFPMFLQIALCVIMLVMSYLFFEAKTKETREKRQDENTKVNTNKVVLLIVISFALSATLVQLGQNNSKLFMQYDFQKALSVEMCTYYITVIVFISRIARLVGDIVFGKLYNKVKDKISIIVTIFLILAFVLLIMGYYLDVDVIYKAIIMGSGFLLILGTRDTFKLYFEDVALEKTSKEEQQKLMVDMEVYKNLFSVIGSGLFTLVLLKYELIVVEFILLGVCVAELAINRRIYNKLNKL